MHLEKTIFAQVDDANDPQCDSNCFHKERLKSGVTKCKQFNKALKYSDSISHHSRCKECLSIFVGCIYDIKQE